MIAVFNNPVRFDFEVAFIVKQKNNRGSLCDCSVIAM